MKRHFLAFIALVLFAVPALAADIKNLDLGKHAEVWFAEDHTVPIVAVAAAMPAGSAYDPGDKPGLASFAASLIDEGAGSMDSKAFHEALADRAIQFRAGVERDYLVVSVVTLTENLPEAMRLLQTALTRPRFDPEAVSRVRTQILQSLAQAESQPPNVARRAFARTFFNGHPYGHPSEGDAASIQAITLEDLKGFAKSHWVRGGIEISVAGDITAAAATKLIADTFKPVPETTPPPLPPIGKLGQPGVHVSDMPVPQPTVIFGLPGIMRQDPDFIAGYVANYIVGGGGFSSRLTDEVRVKRGLTYGIETSLTAFNRASIMQGSVATRADAVRQTIAVVRDTMAKFAAGGATQAELDDAKTFLTGSFPLAFASNAGIASQLNTFQRQGLDIGYVARRNGLIQAVTLDDIKRVAKKLYDPARLTVVVAGTPAEGRSAPEQPKVPVRPTPPLAGSSGTSANSAATGSGTTAPVPPPGVRPAVKPVVKQPVPPAKPATPGP
ncbi:MAG TPA: insulinase family protein [Rhizomicrobium sp.]|jgi:zinc protease|nr:insulinase family protein [Rhizomicrobium sp.]